MPEQTELVGQAQSNAQHVSNVPDLCQKLRHIPYRYDDKGSQYYDQITLTQDYYLTRKEQELLDEKIADIVKDIPKDARLVEIVELGCGMGRKTVTYINGVLSQISGNVRYVPVDISQYYLDQVVVYYKTALPSERLSIQTYCGDYYDFLKELKQTAFDPKKSEQNNQVDCRQLLFMGSNIGNFTKQQTHDFITKMSQCLRKEDMVVLGFDTLYKDTSIIYKAYDSQGLFKQMNLNALSNANKQLGLELNLQHFDHEVNLVDSVMYQQVKANCLTYCQWDGKSVVIPENHEFVMCQSRKFKEEDVAEFYKSAGMKIQNIVFTDDRWFMIAIGMLAN